MKTGIYFDLNKHGKRIAYRWSRLQMRSFPIAVQKADHLIANGEAVHLSCHPIHGPRG